MSKKANRFGELHLIFFYTTREKLEVEVGFNGEEAIQRFKVNHPNDRPVASSHTINLSEAASVGIGFFMVTINRGDLLDRARNRLNNLLEMVQPIIENHRK